MKMKKFSFLALAGVMLGLASCSTEAPYSGKVLENETQTFVKISLVSTDGSGSRAEDGEFADNLFENGLDSENEIKKILLVFYDGGGTYVGNTEITVGVNDTDNDNLSVGAGNDDLTISRVLTTVAEVNLPENTNHPAYVVAFVNPTSAYQDLVNLEKLTDLSKKLRQANTMSNDGMTMNNSVYYDEVLGQPVYAAPVNFTTQFFKTSEEARAKPGVEITIERVQAKVKVESFDGLKDKVTEFKSNEQGEYTLKFVPENWFVNATEKQTFLLKNFRGDNKNYHITDLTANFTTSMSFSDLQSRFTDKDDRANHLNERRRKRSYWALSPTYFYEGSDNYPSISYDVKYYINGTDNINPSPAKEYCLNYVSYNDGVNIGKVDGVRRAYDYCLENTMNLATLKSDRAKAAMTSVVLLGHYVIKNKAGETVFDGASSNGTFYIRHDSSTSKVILLTENAVKDYFLERTGNLIYVRVPAENNPDVLEYQPLRAAHVKGNYASYDDFELEHPKKISKDILGQSVVSEQWRTLKFKDTANLDNYYVYVLKDNTYQYVSLREYGVAKILVNMYSAYGLVESFKNGKAFFNVPLKHIFYNAGLYEHGNASSNEFIADKVQLGDYGVVRNHVYDLTINSITGLGSGIGDLNQPIVPPTEVDRYYISAKLNILKWRIVGQSVDL